MAGVLASLCLAATACGRAAEPAQVGTAATARGRSATAQASTAVPTEEREDGARPLTAEERQAAGPALLVTFDRFTAGGMARLRVAQRGEEPVETIAGTLRWTREGQPVHGPAGRPLTARFHRTALPSLVGPGQVRVVTVGARRPDEAAAPGGVDGAIVELTLGLSAPKHGAAQPAAAAAAEAAEEPAD